MSSEAPGVAQNKTPGLMTDSVEEYDCVTREWHTRQYGEAKTVPSERAEVISGKK